MTTPWHHGPLTVLDFESTGVDTREARIVTGYLATVLGRDQGRTWTVGVHTVVNPGVPIPAGATAVHGVTDEMAQAKGVEPAGAINAFAEEAYRSLVAGIPVVGYNLAYDLSLLYWECLRWNVATVAERMGFPPAAPVGPIIDAYVLDKHVDPWRKGSRKLDDSKGPGVATHYGVPLGDAAHAADADAMASVRVAVAIADRYPEIAGMTLPDLHRAQKGWRAEQAVSLQRYLRTMKGDKTAVCDPCWPLCTEPDHASG